VRKGVRENTGKPCLWKSKKQTWRYPHARQVKNERRIKKDLPIIKHVCEQKRGGKTRNTLTHSDIKLERRYVVLSRTSMGLCSSCLKKRAAPRQYAPLNVSNDSVPRTTTCKIRYSSFVVRFSRFYHACFAWFADVQDVTLCLVSIFFGTAAISYSTFSVFSFFFFLSVSSSCEWSQLTRARRTPRFSREQRERQA
jgi:hypothetical protein